MFKDFFNDGREIYRQSAKRIAMALDMTKWANPMERLVIERIVHALADVAISDAIFFSPNAADIIADGLQNHAPILCDSQMTYHGLIACDNEKFALVDDDRTKKIAITKKITRSHGQIYLWQELLKEKFSTSIIVIGNAPTCLYGLLQGWQENNFPKPKGIIAMPVGFVGAEEAKNALMNFKDAPPYITIKGTRGGSAIAAAATNALISKKSIGDIT
ncbi:MAG: precorrin-8X methylmutase [Alphaproteobacteria bacterium]